MPCGQGVGIGAVMIFKSLCMRMPPKHMLKSAQSAMQSLENCIQCRECENKCPYDLDIMGIFEEHKAYYDELCEQLGAT